MGTPEESALADLKRIAVALEAINHALLAMLDHMKQESTEPPKAPVFGLLGNLKK